PSARWVAPGAERDQVVEWRRGAPWRRFAAPVRRRMTPGIEGAALTTPAGIAVVPRSDLRATAAPGPLAAKPAALPSAQGGWPRGVASLPGWVAGAGAGAAREQGAAATAALTLYGIAVTAGMYALSRRLSQRWPSPFTSPVFFTTCATMVVFLLTRVELSD